MTGFGEHVSGFLLVGGATDPIGMRLVRRGELDNVSQERDDCNLSVTIEETLPISQMRLDAESRTWQYGDMSNPFRRKATTTPSVNNRDARIKAARQAAFSPDRFAPNRFAR